MKMESTDCNYWKLKQNPDLYIHSKSEKREIKKIFFPHPSLLSAIDTGMQLLVYLHQPYLVRATLMNQQVAFFGYPDISDDADTGGNCPALKSFRAGIKPY